MRTQLPRSVRRAGAALLLPAALALAACDAQMDVTINEDTQTVDQTITVWGGALSESDCSAEGLADALPSAAAAAVDDDTELTWTEHKGQPACQVQQKGVSLSELSETSSPVSVTHEDDTYVFELERGSYSREDVSTAYGRVSTVALTVTFPGEVVEASEGARTDGSSVTWPDILEESGTLRAVGGDSAPSSRLPWVLGGAGAVLVAAGAAAAVLARRRHRARQQPPAQQDPAGPQDPAAPQSPDQEPATDS